MTVHEMHRNNIDGIEGAAGVAGAAGTVGTEWWPWGSTAPFEPSAALRARLVAELQRMGPGAVLSHRIAAHLHGLDGVGDEDLDVVVPASSARRGPTVHRSARRVPTVAVAGFPVEAVPECLTHLGAVCPPDTVEVALESALRRGLTSVEHLHVALDGALGRLSGADTLRDVLVRRGIDAPPTRSLGESRLVQVTRAAGFEGLRRQVPVSDRRGSALGSVALADLGRRLAFDVVHPAEGLVGAARTARRLRALDAAGWRVAVWGEHHLVTHHGALAGRLRRPRAAA